MIYRLLLAITVSLAVGCTTTTTPSTTIDLSQPWDSIVAQAKGKPLHFMMWQGSPTVNAYVNDYVKPQLKDLYDIDLKMVGGQGPEIVRLLMREQQAQVAEGQVDMLWINGETFFQLRAIDGLFGPFVQVLPHAQYIDFGNPFIRQDFQQDIQNMECPWSLTQFVLIHDTTKVAAPPKDLASLSTFVKNHPGTFTISNDFSGMTLLKSMLVELAGDPQRLYGEFSEDTYQELSSKLWEWINRHKAFFWQQGQTFPSEQSKMDQMFSSGELLITYGFNEGSIDKKIHQGLYQPSVQAYPWTAGTIRNTNYLGIAFNSPNKAAALVAINFLISPEAQFVKSDPLGMDANTILHLESLPKEWQDKFNQRRDRAYGISMEELQPFAIQEPAPTYMIRLFEDFRTNVIEQ